MRPAAHLPGYPDPDTPGRFPPGPGHPRQPPAPAPPAPVPPTVVVPLPARAEPVDPVALRLLDERVLVLGHELDEAAAERTISRLLLLAALDPRADVTLHLGARSGAVAAGLAVYDTMRGIEPLVQTRAVGLVGPVGALLLAGGAPGRRLAHPHTRIRLGRPPFDGPDGLDDELRAEFTALLAGDTGRSVTEIRDAQATGRWLTAQEAVDFGLVDSVLG